RGRPRDTGLDRPGALRRRDRESAERSVRQREAALLRPSTAGRGRQCRIGLIGSRQRLGRVSTRSVRYSLRRAEPARLRRRGHRLLLCVALAGRAARRRGRRALPPDRAADGSAIRALRILKPRSDALPRRFRSAPNRPASRRQGLPAYPLSTPRAAGRTSVDDTTRPPALPGTTYCHPVANSTPSHFPYERLPGRWP